MRVTTFNDETSVANIVDRLYDRLTPESRKIAEAALLRANPELAKLDRLRPGAILRLPEVPALILKPGSTEDDPAGHTRKMLKDALKSYHQLLAEHLKVENEDLKTQGTLLNKLGRTNQDKPLHKIMEQLKATLGTRISKNGASGQELTSAMNQARKDLSA